MDGEISPQMPSDSMAPAPETQIAGFWRRVGAGFIDYILIGACGLVLGLAFSDQFMRMGGWGRLVGAAVAALYFVPLNSSLGRGNTIGKRALGIRVVNADGETISVLRSLVRFCVLALPFFLNGLAVRVASGFSWWMILPAVAVFGLGPAILYLLVFNRRTRQSVHDLIVGSYVVRDGYEAGAKPSIWKGHYAVLAVILLIILVGLLAVGRLVTRWGGVREVIPAYNAILQEPEVHNAQVVTGRNYFWDGKGGGRTISAVMASVRVNHRIADKGAEAAKIARIILETNPAAANQDQIEITVVEGWDIGIASGFNSERFTHAPAEWRTR
jgi:uncharacterized RDD family membrane protein YckC